jgi:hypothetical protein
MAVMPLSMVSTGDVIRKLARWANTFNVWEWPADYPTPKPVGFDELPWCDPESGQDKMRAMRAHIDALRAIVPHKEIVRDWHINHIGHTNAEFEAWWAKTFDGGAAEPQADAPAIVPKE